MKLQFQVFETWILFDLFMSFHQCNCFEPLPFYFTTPKGLTCWTCPSKSSNEECNKWAPDRFCSTGQNVCMTVHNISLTGELSSLNTISVLKQCANSSQCSQNNVGCKRFSNHMECTSCCDESYCNEAAPQNHTHALSLTRLSTLSVESSASYFLSQSHLLSFLLIFSFWCIHDLATQIRYSPCLTACCSSRLSSAIDTSSGDFRSRDSNFLWFDFLTRLQQSSLSFHYTCTVKHCVKNS